MRKLIKKIKRRLFYRTLIQRYNALNTAVIEEQKGTPNEAKMVALLCDATTLENRKIIDIFVTKLQKEGKKSHCFRLF